MSRRSVLVSAGRCALARFRRLAWPQPLALVGLLLAPAGCPNPAVRRDDEPVSYAGTSSSAGRLESSAASSDFDRRVSEVRKLAARLDTGAALIVSFKNTSSGSSQMLGYVDSTPPERRGSAWLLQGQAFVGGDVVSTFVITLPSLKAGKYRCGADALVRMGATLSESSWNPKAHDTGWTSNGGGYCELDLQSGSKGSDVEGTFSGRLETNDGKGYYLVERGYLYVKVPTDAAEVSAFEQGVSCHRQRDYSCALRSFAKACQEGVGDACFNLGVMFGNGEGVEQDLGKAVTFYEHACKMGVKDGGVRLVKTLQSVCERGDAPACGMLGAIFLDGQVCGRFPFPPQLSLGRELICQSCEDGFTEACKVAQRMETRCPKRSDVRRLGVSK